MPLIYYPSKNISIDNYNWLRINIFFHSEENESENNQEFRTQKKPF